MPLTSTTRLPVDNLISGALLGAITAGGINYSEYKKGNISSKEATKKTIKLSIQGGIAAACAISTSNKIVAKNYLGAAITATLGLGAIVLTENFINPQE